ncbi:MAG: hypothetical protein AB1489_33955, partial [Acidobacteriota bacterium]
MRFVIILILVAILLLPINFNAFANLSYPSYQNEPADGELIMRSSVDLVVVNVTVRDSSGHAIGGLGQENFEIYDNDVLQKISYFSEEDQPVSLGIL